MDSRSDAQGVEEDVNLSQNRVPYRLGKRWGANGTAPTQYLCAECGQSQAEDGDEQFSTVSAAVNLGALRVQDILLRRETELYR